MDFCGVKNIVNIYKIVMVIVIKIIFKLKFFILKVGNKLVVMFIKKLVIIVVNFVVVFICY